MSLNTRANCAPSFLPGVIGQANNFFIFPGVDLGVILSKGKYICDEVFTEKAYKLSELTPDSLIKKGTVYPKINNIRNISANIAQVTASFISKEQKKPKNFLSMKLNL